MDITPNTNEYNFFDEVKKTEEEKSLKKTVNKIGISLVLYAGILFLFYAIIFILISFPAINKIQLSKFLIQYESYLNLAIYLIMFSLPIFFLIKTSRNQVNIKAIFSKPDLKLLVVFFGLFYGVSMFSSSLIEFIEQSLKLIGVNPIQPDYQVPNSIFEIIIFVISMTFMPAIFEELFFRGLILHNLRRFGDTFAIIVSSLLFGFVHQTIPQAINAVILGLLFGFFVVKSGSLWTSIILHFINNSITVVALIYKKYGAYDLSYTVNLYGFLVLGIVGYSIFRVIKDRELFKMKSQTTLLNLKETFIITAKSPWLIISFLYFSINVLTKFH